MSNLQPIDFYTWFSFALFMVGFLGVMIRRNLIILLMCVELMLNAVNILFVATAAYLENIAGFVFTIFMMVIAASEVTIGLALLVCIYRHYRHINSEDLRQLHG